MFTFPARAKILVPAIAAAAALTLAACNSSNDSDSSMSNMSGSATMSSMAHATSSAAPSTSVSGQPADYNEADVTFLQMMYPHHAQAIEMAKLVPSRSQNPEVIALAADIDKAQGPEMEQIASLLKRFGKPAPSADMGHSSSMPGMMTTEQLTELGGKSGAEFDRMFLTMMIEHHTGAIDMGTKEQSEGRNAEVVTLAETIVTAQRAEIETMKTLLTKI
jgi:uncharacterized protein (DUF305 family)